jgi:hypothetical protein
MSFSTVNRCANDQALQQRASACIAQEQLAKGAPADPGQLLGPMMWTIAGASDVEAAYASALAGGNPNPGGDEAVVTDGMILAHVQSGWPA